MFPRSLFSGLLARASAFISSNSAANTKTDKFPFELDTDEKIKLEQLNHQKIKPIIVALYDMNDGSANADLAIQHFEDKGANVIRVSPQQGLSHPVFTTGNINGIYLPGGSDVSLDDNDPRKQFEGELVKKASYEDIPLLGICRGQQVIGYYNGLEIKDLTDYDKHYDGYDEVYHATGNPDFNHQVVVKKGSQLYTALEYKLGNSECHSMEYPVTCLHHQHVLNNPLNENLNITGRSKFDGSIESIEKKTGRYYTIGVQHHSEVTVDACKTARENKIREAREEAESDIFNGSYFDLEFTLFAQVKAFVKINQAQKKSRGEIAAKAELGLFTNQVKKQFLGQNKEQLIVQKRFGE
jgi:gamma-glutamyl-gamma-aminobutyrate hydrolase PuuD